MSKEEVIGLLEKIQGCSVVFTKLLVCESATAKELTSMQILMLCEVGADILECSTKALALLKKEPDDESESLKKKLKAIEEWAVADFNEELLGLIKELKGK